MISPAVDDEHDRPCAAASLGTTLFLALLESSRAVASDLVRRRKSACALPRPSAIASAKFANSTVNHSQAEMAESKPANPCAGRDRAGRRYDVTSAPTSTTNITGFRTCHRGIEFRERIAERARRRSSGRSNERALGRRSKRRADSILRTSFLCIEEVFDDRAERDRPVKT